MEKIKLLLYCTKSKPYLIGRKDAPYKYYLDKGGKDSVMDARDFIHNGKIVAECDFEVEEIKREIITGICGWISPSKYDWCYDKDLLDKSCLTNDMLCDYLDGKNGYAIHIKNLNIFDKPKELSKKYGDNKGNSIQKAPQNMMYCWEYINTTWQDNFKKKIIISIHPEWLVKILDNEKTIEVRKKVLKEMI